MAGEEDDDELFKRAMRGVKPEQRLAHGSRRQPVPVQIAPARPDPITLAVDDDGDFVAGRAPGVSRKQLQSLCRAASPEEEIDLHGLKQAEATRVLISRMSAAAQSGRGVVLVIHGKGNHSVDAVSVLRGATLDALQASPLSGLVSGFATAASRHGGRGALYVFLKKA